MTENNFDTLLIFGNFYYKKENYNKSKNIFLKCIENKPNDFRGEILSFFFFFFFQFNL